MNILLEVLIFLAGPFVIWWLCCRACEYSNFKSGHRFVTAFTADTRFERFFTHGQFEKDIERWNMVKITRIGYAASIICTVSAAIVLPTVAVLVWIHHDLAANVYAFWFFGCIGVCLVAFLAQCLDSFSCWLYDLFH